MSREMTVPMRLGPDNQIAVESDPDAQVRLHVNSLINTAPGERVVFGDYGVPLADMLFESNEAVVASDLSSDIADALATFEPGVLVRHVKPIPTVAGEGIAMVSVEYLRTDSPTTNVAVSRSQNIAVISASGKVSEVVRG